MKCKHCNQEMPQISSKTIKVRSLGIEVEVDVHDKNKTLAEIQIPKGWRLLTITEVVWLANSKYAKELKMDLSSTQDDFYFEQPLNCNKATGYVARFDAGSVGASLNCNRDPSYSNPQLGVRFCREISKKKGAGK